MGLDLAVCGNLFMISIYEFPSTPPGISSAFGSEWSPPIPPFFEVFYPCFLSHFSYIVSKQCQYSIRYILIYRVITNLWQFQCWSDARVFKFIIFSGPGAARASGQHIVCLYLMIEFMNLALQTDICNPKHMLQFKNLRRAAWCYSPGIVSMKCFQIDVSSVRQSNYKSRFRVARPRACRVVFVSRTRVDGRARRACDC